MAISAADANDQRAPSVTAGGATTLVAWEDFRDRLPQRRLRRPRGREREPPRRRRLPRRGGAELAARAGGGLGRHELPGRLERLEHRAVSWDIRAARVTPGGHGAGLADHGLRRRGRPDRAGARPGTGRASSSPGPIARSGSRATSTRSRVTSAGAVQDAAGIAVSTAAGEQVTPDARGGRRRYRARRLGRLARPGEDAYGARIDGGSVLDAVRPRALHARQPAGGAGDRLGRHRLPRRLAGRAQLGRRRRLRGPARRRRDAARRHGHRRLGRRRARSRAGRRLERHELPRRLAGLPLGHRLRRLRGPCQRRRRRARPRRDRRLDRGRRPAVAVGRLRRHRLPRHVDRRPFARHERGGRLREPRRTRPAPCSTPAGSRSRPPRAPSAPLSVAHDGTGWLVAWEDRRGGAFADVYAARVNSAGTRARRARRRGLDRRRRPARPALAWNGGNFVLAWEDRRSGTSYDVYAARVSSAGSRARRERDRRSSTPVNDQRFPRVARDGTSVLVVWQDARSGSSLDVYAARLSSGGSSLDGMGEPVAASAADERAPAAVSGPSGSAAVVYQRFAAEPLHGGVQRVVQRLFDTRPWVTVGAAGGIGVSTATLNGLGQSERRGDRPGGSSGGTTAAYGSQTPVTGAGSGTVGRPRLGAADRAHAGRDLPLPAGGDERLRDGDELRSIVRDAHDAAASAAAAATTSAAAAATARSATGSAGTPGPPAPPALRLPPRRPLRGHLRLRPPTDRGRSRSRSASSRSSRRRRCRPRRRRS